MDGQVMGFNPLAHPNTEHATRALTLAIRGLRAGERVVLEDGTMIRSIAVRHGAHLQRRFVVLPKEAGSSAKHRSIRLGQNSFKSATEAAQNALTQKGASSGTTDDNQF